MCYVLCYFVDARESCVDFVIALILLRTLMQSAKIELYAAKLQCLVNNLVF